MYMIIYKYRYVESPKGVTVVILKKTCSTSQKSPALHGDVQSSFLEMLLIGVYP